LGPREELSSTQQQVHLSNITPNPKTTSNEIKTSKTKLFYELPWMLYKKTKMEQRQEEERSVPHQE